MKLFHILTFLLIGLACWVASAFLFSVTNWIKWNAQLSDPEVPVYGQGATTSGHVTILPCTGSPLRNHQENL